MRREAEIVDPVELHPVPRSMHLVAPRQKERSEIGGGVAGPTHGRAPVAVRAPPRQARYATRLNEAARLVDIGGFRLAVECGGEGVPAIVLEAGGACTSAAWDSVWSAIRALSRSCRYDRAGLGRSERSPHPRTVRQMVAELHQLLVETEVAPPYILVGHSFGVPIIRVFAGTYPSEVAGLVFVDPAQEDLELRMTPYLSEDGLHQLRAQWDAMPDNPENVSYARLAEIEEGLRTVGRRLPGVPLTVLVSQDAGAWAGNNPPWWPLRDFLRVSLEMGHDLARLSPLGKLVVAERSGHWIQNDEPHLVIEAIRQILDMTRSR
jgi:pimeloyl-ACP methyl ester carboxylesterase